MNIYSFYIIDNMIKIIYIIQKHVFITKGNVKDKEIDKTSSKCEFKCKASGHICCQLSDGMQECRKENNCPKQSMYENS